MGVKPRFPIRVAPKTASARPDPWGGTLPLGYRTGRRDAELPNCLFATDLHGRVARYRALFDVIDRERPAAVFLGGDLLPAFGFAPRDGEEAIEDFLRDFLWPGLRDRPSRPRVFLILGNDDPRSEEPAVYDGAAAGVWEYVHDAPADLGDHRVYGYSYVPPTPFRMKDWERYDVSRFVDPGCVSPEEGSRTVPIPAGEARYGTITEDLKVLADGEGDLSNAIFLFHSPPYRTHLDRAALDGKLIDHVPLDVNVGSIAIRRFLEERQPLLSLHGHIHESARITGEWRDTIGRTHCLGAAHDGPELALVRFDPEDPAAATRELIG